MQVKKTFRIGIDCRLSGPKHAGIGRYIENLLQQLPHIKDLEIEWVFFFYDKTQWNAFLKKQTTHKAFFEQTTIAYAPVRHYSLDEQVRIPAIFAERNLDLLHIPHFNIPFVYPGKIVVTIHDLLWHEYRGLQVTTLSPLEYWVKYGMYRLVVRQAVQKAKKIFVPAETTKQTLKKYFPGSAPKVIVTHEGVESTFLKSQKHASLHSKNLIYVGSLYPHKNIEVVLQGLVQLSEYSLHIVGSRNVFQDNVRTRVKELQLEDRVSFHGYLTDEQLIDLFHNCTALVQPSFFEGFGLTGIEAMASHLPVLASDIPIFHEIYDRHAVFFNPKSVESFCQATLQIEHKTSHHIDDARTYVEKQFSWEKMAKQTVEAYVSILKS